MHFQPIIFLLTFTRIWSTFLHDIFQDPEIESVWLQSQDFIGLGFNIAGSMRDGIFVSQVHNRGPAIESGKFKVGTFTKYLTYI